MARSILDEQFALLPMQVKASLIGVMDAISNAGRQGELEASRQMLRNLSRLDAVPPASQSVLRKTEEVALTVLQQEHVERLHWAQAEGFFGFDAFIVALGRTPQHDPGEEPTASAEPPKDDESAPDDTPHVFAHALDAIATGTHSLETTQSLVAASMDEIDPVALATALARLAHDLLTRWAAAAGADRDDAWLAWSQMVREEA